MPLRPVTAAGLSHFRWPWSSEGPCRCPPGEPVREPPRPSRRGLEPWPSVQGKVRRLSCSCCSASSGPPSRLCRGSRRRCPQVLTALPSLLGQLQALRGESRGRQGIFPSSKPLVPSSDLSQNSGLHRGVVWGFHLWFPGPHSETFHVQNSSENKNPHPDLIDVNT